MYLIHPSIITVQTMHDMWLFMCASETVDELLVESAPT